MAKRKAATTALDPDQIVSVTIGEHGLELRFADGTRAFYGRPFLKQHKGKDCKAMIEEKGNPLTTKPGKRLRSN